MLSLFSIVLAVIVVVWTSDAVTALPWNVLLIFKFVRGWCRDFHLYAQSIKPLTGLRSTQHVVLPRGWKKPFPFSMPRRIPRAPPWSQDVTFPHVDITSKNFKTSTGSSSTNVSTSNPSPSPICPSILAPPYLTELLHQHTPLPPPRVCPWVTGSTPLPLPFPLSSLSNSPSEHTSAHNLWWPLLSSSLSHMFPLLMDYCSLVLSRKKRKAWYKSSVKLL